MTQRFLITGTLLAAALLAAAVPASAQLAPQRPSRTTRALFGPGSDQTSQRLVLNASFGMGYDHDLTPRPALVSPSAVPLRSGQFSLGSASLNYSVDRDKIRASLSAGVRGRYYSGQADPLVWSYFGGGQLALSTNLGSRTTLSTSINTGIYLRDLSLFYNDAFAGPDNGFGTGTVSITAVDPNAFVSGSTYFGFGGSLQIGHRLTSRLSFGAAYSYYGNNAWSVSGGTPYAAQTAGAGVSYDLAKGLSLRLGYSLTDAGFGAAQSGTGYRGQSFDGGINFNRALSLTRRTVLSFATGLTGISDRNLNTRFWVTGNAALSHELGRSWNLGVAYNRSANFYQTFGQPIFNDTLSTGVGGLIGRRLQVNAGVGVIKGVIGVVANAPGYRAANASVGLHVGIVRNLALSVNYSLFYYQFDDNAPLPPGLLSRLDRQSVRVSLDVWAPLFTRARRTNAAR